MLTILIFTILNDAKFQTLNLILVRVLMEKPSCEVVKIGIDLRKNIIYFY